MLSTMQNVGNALGVAITGVIFFGALHGGYAHAFRLALVELAALLVAVVALTRLLPAHRHGSHAVTRDAPAHGRNDYLAGNGSAPR
jgi:hypothetical protein